MRLSSNPLAAKILISLLYGEPTDTVWEGFEARVRLSSLSRAVESKNSRVKDALRVLHDKGYISSLEFTYGHAKLRITVPAPIARLM